MCVCWPPLICCWSGPPPQSPGRHMMMMAGVHGGCSITVDYSAMHYSPTNMILHKHTNVITSFRHRCIHRVCAWKATAHTGYISFALKIIWLIALYDTLASDRFVMHDMARTKLGVFCLLVFILLIIFHSYVSPHNITIFYAYSIVLNLCALEIGQIL